MCGEDSAWPSKPKKDTKTPPHVWGRQKAGSNAPAFCENTPTCVGKTLNDH